jgi:hypothetical protein
MKLNNLKKKQNFQRNSEQVCNAISKTFYSKKKIKNVIKPFSLFDGTIFFGDLNYRLNLPRLEVLIKLKFIIYTYIYSLYLHDIIYIY